MRFSCVGRSLTTRPTMNTMKPNPHPSPAGPRRALRSWILASLAALTSTATAEEARLLRFPAIQGDKLAFCYAGDLWTCSADGGTAHRVTSFDEGYELYPRI